MRDSVSENLENWFDGLGIAEYDPLNRKLVDESAIATSEFRWVESFDELLNWTGSASPFPVAGLLQAAQNGFADALPEDYERLKTLEESLPKRLHPFMKEFESHQESIEKAEEMWGSSPKSCVIGVLPDLQFRRLQCPI